MISSLYLFFGLGLLVLIFYWFMQHRSPTYPIKDDYPPTGHPPTGHPPTGHPPTDHSPVLIYEQTACYGTCPVYKVTFARNGTVFYQGQENVPRAGRGVFTTQVPMSQLQSYLAEADRLDLWSLADEYDGPVTDLPSAYLTLYRPTGEVKKIHARVEIPPKLQSYLTRIHEDVMRLVK